MYCASTQIAVFSLLLFVFLLSVFEIPCIGGFSFLKGVGAL